MTYLYACYNKYSPCEIVSIERRRQSIVDVVDETNLTWYADHVTWDIIMVSS